MSQASDVLEVNVRTHLFRTGSWTKPSTIHIALYTAAPGEAGGGTEVSGGSYARVAVNPLDANWNAASSTDGQASNAADITFPAPTANWGVVTHHQAIFDQAGSPYALYGTLAQSKTINNGDPAPKFLAGALVYTVS